MTDSVKKRKVRELWVKTLKKNLIKEKKKIYLETHIKRKKKFCYRKVNESKHHYHYYECEIQTFEGYSNIDEPYLAAKVNFIVLTLSDKREQAAKNNLLLVNNIICLDSETS
jgi:hypothetical protein